MSTAGLSATSFYRDVAKTETVWTIEDDVGYPAPMTKDGKRSMPFWSSKSRAAKIIADVSAYDTFTPKEFTLKVFLEEWLPELDEDGMLVGLNWAGKRAVGYDAEPLRVVEAIKYQLAART